MPNKFFLILLLIRALSASAQNIADDEAQKHILAKHAAYAQKDDAARLPDVLWIVDHYPGDPQAGEASMQFEPTSLSYPPAKEAWLRAVAAHRADARVLGNAARFMASEDPAHAAKLYQEAMQMDPNNSGWPALLGQLYGTMILAGTDEGGVARQGLGQMTDPRVLHAAGAALAGSAYTAIQTLSQDYLTRAASIDPDNQNPQQIAWVGMRP